MKKAIKQKLLNLITFNPIDYCIKSQMSIKHLDILKYVKKTDFINFINGEVNQIEISAASGITNFEESLKKTTNCQDFISLLISNGFSVSENRTKELNSNFETNKKKSITYFVDQMKSFKKQFITLNRFAKNYSDDTTIWPLYISYQFLKGRIGIQTAVKAPLILFKVQVIEEGSKLFLRAINDEKSVNEKIKVVMNKEFPGIIVNQDLLLNLSLEENISQFNKMVGYEIPFEENGTINFIQEDAKKIYENYNTFRVEPSALLGIFEPGGSSLKEDLKIIIEKDIDPFDSQIENNVKPKEYYQEKVIKDLSLIEVDKPLNIYQKYAVSSALSQSTLIYGPPGTGKSEVIANILTNALIKGKSSLMVSEKKAALDVLTERINSLSQFTLFLCDPNKEIFYKKINALNDLLGTQWYRENSRSTKSAIIEPIKFHSDELMFFKNYQDWYGELIKLVKKHWSIEDYSDGIFKMDYADNQRIRNELGDQICIEWLTTINIENVGNVTLYDAIKKIYNQYNFSKIEDMFNEYLIFKKFIKKYNLIETLGEGEVLKHLKFVNQKIISNTKIVEKYLLGGNKIFTLFNEYFEFTKEFKGKNLNDFLEKTYKEKKNFMNILGAYLEFRNKVIDKDPVLKEMDVQHLTSKIKVMEKFIEKYNKELIKENWLDFIKKNSNKIIKFNEVFSASLSNELKEVVYAEFISNSNIITKQEECTLSFKDVKNNSKNMNIIINIFKAFEANFETLDTPYIEEFIRFKDLFKYNISFLERIKKIEDIFLPINQDILKEWEWISLPYIKQLYLNPLVLFDLDKTQAIMQTITTPINNKQFMMLKVIGMWNDIIKEIPMFLEIKGVHLQDIITQLRRESKRAASLVEEITFKKYINNLRNLLCKLSKDDKDEIANVFRIASTGTMPPITSFVKKYYRSLKILFPIWVARPDNVSDMIPLIENEFDYGIFDEASQISIERSYPIVYRCNIKVVSGDDKQLKPSSFFMSKVDNSDFDIDDFDRVESLLERAKVSWWNEFHLRNHYRSETKELIEFSNKFIYNNNLEVASKANSIKNGIEIYNVNGLWEQVNKAEADKVLDLLVELYEKYEKILIITFNSKQSILIENLLFERQSKLPLELRERIESGKIIITNLENVQGNEGDLVILSVSYGKNIEGIVKNNFGPLNASGGSNRLNVAITRARSKMIIVKSIYGNQIKVSNVNNKNAIIFKKFIDYIDAINDNKTIDSIDTNIIEEVEETDITENIEVENIKIESVFSSLIVKEIYSDLVKTLNEKYKVVHDYEVGSKKIDLMISNRNSGEIIKAVIIEPWKTNRGVKEMLEDIDRQYFLEDRGYSTFRVKEYEWSIDKNKLISKIKDSLTPNKQQNIDYVIWQTSK